MYNPIVSMDSSRRKQIFVNLTYTIILRRSLCNFRQCVIILHMTDARPTCCFCYKWYIKICSDHQLHGPRCLCQRKWAAARAKHHVIAAWLLRNDSNSIRYSSILNLFEFRFCFSQLFNYETYQSITYAVINMCILKWSFHDFHSTHYF